MTFLSTICLTSDPTLQAIRVQQASLKIAIKGGNILNNVVNL